MSAGDLNNHSTELKFPSNMYVWAYNGFMSFLLVLDWIVLVTMQGQKESPPDMQCKDKFLLQSVVAPDGTTTKDINSDMFNKEDEESDEGSSPSRPSVFENGDQDTSLLDAVSKSLEEPKEKSSETWSMISRLTEEKLLPCLQQKSEASACTGTDEKTDQQKNMLGVSLYWLFFWFGLFGILVGYIFK
ncbi:vesicle-associated protein [Populus alba x Populus x berolinensis]|nr:vesicle-associated protein [Populus alba x Populus x berolinensis]